MSRYGHVLLPVLWGSLSCCTTWRLNVLRRGSATPQPRVVNVVVAAQSPADYGCATYATPPAAVGEVCPSLLPARFAMTPLMSVLHPERSDVARCERRTSLPANAVCWHAGQWASPLRSCWRLDARRGDCSRNRRLPAMSSRTVAAGPTCGARVTDLSASGIGAPFRQRHTEPVVLYAATPTARCSATPDSADERA